MSTDWDRSVLKFFCHVKGYDFFYFVSRFCSISCSNRFRICVSFRLTTAVSIPQLADIILIDCYFDVGELLRSSFYHDVLWQRDVRNNIVINSRDKWIWICNDVPYLFDATSFCSFSRSSIPDRKNRIFHVLIAFRHLVVFSILIVHNESRSLYLQFRSFHTVTTSRYENKLKALSRQIVAKSWFWCSYCVSTTIVILRSIIFVTRSSSRVAQTRL